MGITRLPFNTIVESLGATHHFPMTGPDPRNNELLGGPDLAVRFMRNYAYEDRPLLPNSAIQYATTWGNNWSFGLTGITNHFTNAGLSEYTIAMFYRTSSGGPSGAMSFDVAGEIGSPSGGLNLVAFKVYSDGSYQRHHNRTAGGISTGPIDPNVDGIDLGLILSYTEHCVLGHIMYFPTALSAEDLTYLYDQRTFEAKISGTATVDGDGSTATIRAYTRTGGHLAGKTTAAADGTYDLWVTEPDKLDIIATAPDGVDARPLVHGPITPIDP